MELVFIHGWGFTADFWNPVCELLPQFRKRCVDLGFYGNPTTDADFGDDSILIGHSLGFVHGINRKKDWKGWIAINSFPRFVKQDDKDGCTSAAELQQIKMGLSFLGAMALSRFYGLIRAQAPDGTPDIKRLIAGLDELRDTDIENDPGIRNVTGCVLASHNDPLVPDITSEALRLNASKCDIIWHEKGGHILPQRDPAFCAQAIENFVRHL